MFKMTKKNINTLESLDTDILTNPKVGGISYFQGVVRNHNEGHDVTSLEYDSYIAMADKVGLKILKDSKEKFDIVEAYCEHRVGHLEINDTAVWVVVTSHHRREAFEACQYIIDMVKDSVPIWKREHYVNKAPEWVACHRCMEHAAHQHKHSEKCNHEHKHEN